MTVCIGKSLKISTFEDPTLDSSLKVLLGNSPLTRHHMMWLTFFRLYFFSLLLTFGHNNTTFLTAAAVYPVPIQVIGWISASKSAIGSICIKVEKLTIMESRSIHSICPFANLLC